MMFYLYFRKGSVVVNFAIVWNTNTTSDMDEDTLNQLLLEALVNSSGDHNYTMDMNNTQIDGKRFTAPVPRSTESTMHVFQHSLVSQRTSSTTHGCQLASNHSPSWNTFSGHINVSRIPPQPLQF